MRWKVQGWGEPGDIYTTIFSFFLSCNVHWYVYTVKPVLRGHIWDTEKVAFEDRSSLKRGSINMNFFMTAHEKCDLLIQMTAE